MTGAPLPPQGRPAFEGPAPRVFGLPPGADFPAELCRGLHERFRGAPPEALARVEIHVNTQRMARRLTALFEAGPARLLPRIRLLAEAGAGVQAADLPAPSPPLRRQLELARAIDALLSRAPGTAPRAALHDLAESLASLMDEMQGEGVAPAALHGLDVGAHAGHWAESLRFLDLLAPYFDAAGAVAPGAAGRQRLLAERLAAAWREAPPEHPVIVAGSTGSRGATALFQRAVARLPQGAVVLPGFDFDQPAAVWKALDAAAGAEDHPQRRFGALLDALGLDPGAVRPWRPGTAPSPERNRLVSLALRPAPVTDQWMAEGPALTGLAAATDAVTLIEAPSGRAEALAIALCLRRAAEDGQTAALVTPDRMLTRQVTAALDRWGIEPDDSAGRPLPLSPPGRFLGHVAALFGRPLTGEALLTLLKHPLTHSGGDRGWHLLRTRELELSLRRHGPAFPDAAALADWAGTAGRDAGCAGWAAWLGRCLGGADAGAGKRPLADRAAEHLALAEALAAGPDATGAGTLWAGTAGEEAAAAMAELAAEAGHGPALSAADYEAVLHGVLQARMVRETVTPHPGVMIWGTLEARVQGADLVILGGLNEGIWPDRPPPDPWLNRAMRAEAGLVAPERRIGLAAHDFQQAVAARQVVLARALRDDEAPTVPARWLNRLSNLLAGLSGNGGPQALARMRARGAGWLSLAGRLERPAETTAPAPRPAPCPPVADRPASLAVTDIRTLIRDPYAIYARRVLGLRRLDPLRPAPDALLRGTILHEVLERFLRDGPLNGPAGETGADRAGADRDRLLATADAVLAARAPWPAARRLWRARLARIAGWFLDGEAARQAEGGWALLEERGEAAVPGTGVTLTAKPDRIDRLATGGLAVYDYKTGTPPTRKQMASFDKQLLLEAAMAERGAFPGLDPAAVTRAAYIGLGASPLLREADLEDGAVAAQWDGLARLLAAYTRRGRGYTARRAVERRGDRGDYDHLARYGEWDDADAPAPREVP